MAASFKRRATNTPATRTYQAAATGWAAPRDVSPWEAAYRYLNALRFGRPDTEMKHLVQGVVAGIGATATLRVRTDAAETTAASYDGNTW